MSRKVLPSLLMTLVVSILVIAFGRAAEPDYKEYKSTSSKIVYFELAFDGQTIELIVPRDGSTTRVIYKRPAIKAKMNTVTADGKVLFDKEGAWIEGELFAYSNIAESRIRQEGDRTVVSFLTRTGDTQRTNRIRQGNLIDANGEITIDEDEFIRGIVFSVNGDMEIYGEVNKDAVALLGDIFVGPGGVVRGDVVSVTGRVDVAADAAVYGGIYSGASDRRVHRYRFRRRSRDFFLDGSGYYNRVDGLALANRIGYEDPDSLLPSAWLEAGYAFESKRGRYDIGFEQTILRSFPMAVGASVYRRLATEDKWLRKTENTALALLAREDYLDYYEAEGATAWVKAKPWPSLLFKGGYLYEETGWLAAERDLWSLFGGDKKFGANFGSVDSSFRQQGIAEIDTTTNAALFALIDFDTRDEEDYFGLSAWALTGWIEWSHPDIRSDFDFRRYSISLRRYQKVNRRTILLVRGQFGGSDGYLPMYKRFFLGGPGTLHGYEHKEFMGTRYWLASTEYRVDFPRTDLDASIFWDMGQIANDRPLGRRAEVRNSLGVSLYLGDDFKISLAKRLDRSGDDDPLFYARFEHVF